MAHQKICTQLRLISGVFIRQKVYCKKQIDLGCALHTRQMQEHVTKHCKIKL